MHSMNSVAHYSIGLAEASQVSSEGYWVLVQACLAPALPYFAQEGLELAIVLQAEYWSYYQRVGPVCYHYSVSCCLADLPS